MEDKKVQETNVQETTEQEAEVLQDEQLENVSGGVIEAREVTFYEVTCACDNGHKFEVQLTAKMIHNSDYTHYKPCPVCGKPTIIW